MSQETNDQRAIHNWSPSFWEEEEMNSNPMCFSNPLFIPAERQQQRHPNHLHVQNTYTSTSHGQVNTQGPEGLCSVRAILWRAT